MYSGYKHSMSNNSARSSIKRERITNPHRQRDMLAPCTGFVIQRIFSALITVVFIMQSREQNKFTKQMNANPMSELCAE